MSTSKLIDSSTAFLFEIPRSNSPLVVQELQIGGSRACASSLLLQRVLDGALEVVEFADQPVEPVCRKFRQ